MKKQTQYANRAKAFAPHQNFGPAISEAAEPRCATPSAIKLPDTLAGLRRSLASHTVLHQKLRNILLVWCCLVIAGCANQPISSPVSQAWISLKQARRSRADAKTAIGYYLNAADSALKSANSSSPDCQAIYNSACQELAILLKADPALWNQNEVVSG